MGFLVSSKVLLNTEGQKVEGLLSPVLMAIIEVLGSESLTKDEIFGKLVEAEAFSDNRFGKMLFNWFFSRGFRDGYYRHYEFVEEKKNSSTENEIRYRFKVKPFGLMAVSNPDGW